MTKTAVENEEIWREWQEKLDKREITYNQLVKELYVDNQREKFWAAKQQASWERVRQDQDNNKLAAFRNVGLVIETRPDLISKHSLLILRQLGCTKVQIGVHSVNDQVLASNKRGINKEQIARAFSLLRLFGFKIHAHFMANLLGGSVEGDKRDYQEFVSSAQFLPDEIKIYPCSLLKTAPLMDYYEQKLWRPYRESELLEVLVEFLRQTPEYMRVTRMIRDISSGEIVVGNKKSNFRQLVEQACLQSKIEIKEIRSREVRASKFVNGHFLLKKSLYQTEVSKEYFLQFVNQDKRLVGFLRLSLPKKNLQGIYADLPEDLGKTAMIREVHIYGVLTALRESGNYQHAGYGRRLINKAIEIAKKNGYKRLKVISAIGTRAYYEKLGFCQNGLYHEINTDMELIKYKNSLEK